jgi:hypothetical protein
MKMNKFWLIVFGSAVLVGVLYVAPQALIWKNLDGLGKTYETVQITHRGDVTQTYLTRAREVYDGHFPPIDLHIASSQDSSALFPPLSPLIFSYVIRTAGGNINSSFLLADFIFPAVIFIFSYILGFIVVRRKVWSLMFAFLWTLTPLPMHLPNLFSSLSNFLDIAVKNFYPFVNTKMDKLFLDRIDDPLLTYPFLIIALISIFLFWEKPKVFTAIFSGLMAGLLSYIYFHYWVYITIVLGIIFLWNIFVDSKKNIQRFRNGIVMMIVFVLIISPYLYNYYKFNSLDTTKDYIGRIGIEEGRFFRFFDPFPVLFDYLFYVVLSVGVYLILFRKGYKDRAILYWIFIAGMFLVWNIQLITGFVPSPSHWWKAISPVILIILFDIAYNLSMKFNQREMVLLLMVLIFLLITKKTVNAVQFMEPEKKFVSSGTSEFTYSFDKEIAESFSWMNLNLSKEPRVVSDSFLTSFYMLSYTSARPFLPTWCNTLTGNNEIAGRFLIANKLFNVDSETVYQRLKGGKFVKEGDLHTMFNKLKGAQHAFSNYFKKDNNLEFRYIDEAYAQKIVADYEFIDINNKGDKFDYIYYGPWERQFSAIDFGQNSGLELVFKNSDVEIYKIAKTLD